MNQPIDTRGSTGLLLVLIVAVFVILGGLLFSKGKEKMPTSESQSAAIALENIPKSVNVVLESVAPSTQKGKAKLRSFNGDTAVTVGITDFVHKVIQPAQIREGTCENMGVVLYTLNELTQEVVKVPEGFSDTVIDMNMRELLSRLPLSLVVYQSKEEVHRVVACGEIHDTEDTDTSSATTTIATSTLQASTTSASTGPKI